MLRRKMLRDMRTQLGSYFACLILVIMGLIAYTSFAIARDNLIMAQEEFYEEQRFADGFIELRGMPRHHLSRVEKVEGIKEVTGRLIRDVEVYKPEREESTYLRLVSIDLQEEERLNDFLLLEGRPLARKRLRGWIDRPFFEENHLEIEQSLDIIAGDRVQELEIAGMGISPEFVYPLRTETEIYHNPELFGIVFLPRSMMWRLFPDMDNTLNSVVFTLTKGADFDRVKETLEVELDRYGIYEIYPREDQSSHYILEQEIEVINTMATFFPVMILFVSGFIIYVVLKRLVQQQRGQIGILKALGYTNGEILFHYLSYSLILAVIGGTIGGLVGMWLANPLTYILYEFFYLPEIYEGFSLLYLFLGILICLSVLGFAGYHGSKSVIKLPPAEAMRPPAPVYAKKTFIEKVPVFTALLTMQGKMAVRNLSRNRSRSAFIFLGIMISCAMVTFTWALATETMPTFMFYQHQEVERYDVKINLEEPRPRQLSQQEVARFPGVVWAEPKAEVPVTLEHHGNEEHVVLMGLPPYPRLYKIQDVEGRRIVPSDDGLILSERLADNLDVSVGSTIELESLYMRDPDDTRKVRVIDIIPQYIGMNAYMKTEGLESLLEQGPFVTSILAEFSGEPDAIREQMRTIRDHFRESDLVAGIDSRHQMIEVMQEWWELAGWILQLYVLIGVVFSFAVIYVSSIIILSERNRELASMRVLGLTSEEVLSVITFEQWFLAFFAIIAGAPLGWVILQAFAAEWSTDMYSMPTTMSFRSFLVGALITFFSILVAQRFAMKKIRRLNLVEVLKTRE